MRASRNEYQRARRARFVEWLNEYKLARGCADCGYAGHPAAMDFDHLPGHEKSFAVGNAHNRNFAAVLAEIDKCEVVCATCHRIRTYERGQYGLQRTESTVRRMFVR